MNWILALRLVATGFVLIALVGVLHEPIKASKSPADFFGTTPAAWGLNVLFCGGMAAVFSGLLVFIWTVAQ